MQQRRPRLGDILDDYCPRERRVTNHAVVAIVDDDVRQTRCTTCDAEHEYRQAKVPTPRRTKSQAARTHDAGDEARPVLAAQRPAAEPSSAVDAGHEVPDDLEVPALLAPVSEPLPDTVIALESAPAAEPQDAGDAADLRDDDGPVHRRLIRATFPRPEGHVPERREPEFTIRQPGGRGREGDGNRFGVRSRNQRNAQPGGTWNYGGRHGGFGSDGQRGGRGPGADRQGGGQNRGQRHGGGAGRKGGR
jgi:hypothetical protein